MYFGAEGDDVETSRSPVLLAFFTVGAGLMLVGVVTTFGVEGAAASAAAMLVN
jgi:NADH-quinone oxidoreductase subunit N